MAYMKDLTGRRLDSFGVADWEESPILIPTGAWQVATGSPTIGVVTSGNISIPGWSMSGGTSGQSLATTVTGLPTQCAAVKVEVFVTTAANGSANKDVFRLISSQPTEGDLINAGQVSGRPNIAAATNTGRLARRALNTYLPVDPSKPLMLRVIRENADGGDDWASSTFVIHGRITPLAAPPAPVTVQSATAYNTWPMMQSVGGKLVAVYCRGPLGHTIPDVNRAIYCRTSTDGITWSSEASVINNATADDVPLGKGLDSSGNLLLWVRKATAGPTTYSMQLWRSTDQGATFSLISSPTFAVNPVQITDIIAVPTVGLMAFYHGAHPAVDGSLSWGYVKSTDNGVTWTQTVVGSSLSTNTAPTEIAAAYLGSGRIICIGRVEWDDATITTNNSYFQMQSSDYGATWGTTVKTNITDIQKSTPSLIYDTTADLLHLYYFQRGQGVLRHRVVDPDTIWSNSYLWPDSEAVALGSTEILDAGNVNSTVHSDGSHRLIYYSGNSTNTAILVATVEP